MFDRFKRKQKGGDAAAAAAAAEKEEEQQHQQVRDHTGDANGKEEQIPSTVGGGAGGVIEGHPSNDLQKKLSLHEGDIDEENIVYPPMTKVLPIVVGLYLGIFLVALDQTIIATAIPKITDAFQALNDVGWYGSAYLLTMTAFQPTFGKIYKMFKIKWVYMECLFVFEVGSLICGVAPNSTTLIIGRAIAGLGVSGIFSGALVIIAYLVPLSKRPIFFGAAGGCFGIASIVGPLLGGAFADHVSWRWCFYINLPIGGITLLIVFLMLKIPSRATERMPLREKLSNIDFYGACLLIPGIICLLLALQWGGNVYPWNNGRIIALFVLFGVLIIAFVFVQFKRGELATIPPRVFTQRTVLSSALFICMFGAAFFILIFYLPIYFQAIKGSSATTSGIQLLPLILSLVVASILIGGIVTAFGHYYPFIPIGAAIFAVGSGLLTTLGTSSSTGKWLGYQLLTGFGGGAAFQLPIIAVQNALPLADIPIGTAIIMFFQTLGGALFIAVGQSVFTNALVSKIAKLHTGFTGEQIISFGATNLASNVDPNQIAAILEAYANALDQTFTVAVGVSCASFFAAIFVERKKIVKDQMKAAAGAAMA